MPRVYADTLLFFNVFRREQLLWPESLKVLLAAERKDIQLVSSTLVLAEVIGVRGDFDTALQDETIDRFLEGGDVEWSEVDLLVVRKARELARTYNLRGADAVHLATAVRLRADYFMSRDGDFPYGQTVEGVAVRFPSMVWDPTLDDFQVDSEAAEEERQRAESREHRGEKRS